MTSHRFLFYAPDTGAGSKAIILEGDEHHHLARVLRIRPGDDVYATNGRGLMAACRVESVDGSRAVLAVMSGHEQEAGPGITLALALIRKERFARALEQCVELGVTRVIPFAAAGSHLRRIGTGSVERLRRVAISAMKQSFRAFLPRVEAAVSFTALLDEVAAAPRALVGAQHGKRRAEMPDGSSRATLVVVGPEAGFAEEEMAALEGAGAVPLSVSRHRLRSETAAVALVAALAQAD
jgi:16S rRNA (uracil1498-N3)-methyltransferase